MKESQPKLTSNIKPLTPTIRNEIPNPRSMSNRSISKQQQDDKHILNIENYQIFKPAKESKLSRVYFVKDKRTNKKYAAKSSLQEQDPQQQLFILREINILMRIQHRTIVGFEGVSFLDFEKHDKITIFINYIERGSLADLLNDERLSLLPIEYDDTSRQIILVGISYGMNLLHKNNIIHRDLKAENVLIDNEFKPHITDFGLSKFFDPMNSQFQSMSCCGTIEYMAPEVIDGEGFNTKADVYSFGILMYEVVTGLRAYCNNKKELDIFRFMRKIKDGMRPEFPKGYQINDSIKELINRCWSRNPKERPTFSEIYKMLSLTDSKYVDSYCLEGVNKDELSLYIDEITTECDDNNDDNNIENENNKLKIEYLKLKKDNEQMSNMILKAQNENLKLKKDNEQMSNIISKTQNENLKLKKDNEQMSNIISKTQNENLKLKKDNEQMSNMISKAQNENLKLKKDNEQMSNMISKTQNENLKLKKDNEQMSNMISKAQNENLKLKKDNEQMSNMISKTQNENLKLTSNNQQLQKEIAKMNEIISNLRSKQNENKIFNNPNKTTQEKIQIKDQTKNKEITEISRLPQLHNIKTSTSTNEKHKLSEADLMKDSSSSNKKNSK
ncbi:hypothetical protein M9Y10_007760 [Tritrichomonas musculus]|uniref:Protein kinase domain-containing protein n=1 Tax=Tritrichomonas musculus TaxID=1915356 RepID=A0ABR2J363_9EUKA